MKLVKVIMLFSLISVGVLCGCQSTPEEVRENMKEYGENEQIKESEITYCSPEELKHAKISDVVINDSKIIFPDNVDFSKVETVEKLHLSWEEDFYDNRDKYIDLFGIDRSRIEYMEDTDGRSDCFSDEKTGNYFAVCDDGFISYVGGLTAGFFNDDVIDSKCEKYYDIEKEDISGTDVKLNGETASLNEIVNNAKKWLDVNMKIDGFEYVMTDAAMKKLYYEEDEPKDLLSLTAEMTYKGIYMNNHVGGYNSKDGEFHGFIPYDVIVNYDSSDVMSCFSNGGGRMQLNSTEFVDKIVDFKSAVSILCEKLSGFTKIEIAEVLPVYITELVEKSEDGFQPGLKIDANPAYVFLVYGDYDYNGHTVNKMNSYKNYFMVDMITGEFITNLGNYN